MTTDALPCIACGKRLENVMSDVENQPYDGTVFVSHGNYGSTVYDPFDGSFIIINVCDTCLTKAGEEQKVLCGRGSRPVTVDGVLETSEFTRVVPMRVGHQELHDQPLVYWHAGLAEFDDVLHLERGDLDEPLPKGVHLSIEVELLKKDIDDYDARNP